MMKSLIKLADNPLDDDSDEEESKVDNSTVRKGRRVSGPRTKLSMGERLDRMEKGILTLAHVVKHVANGGMALDGEMDPLDEYEEEEDPMAVDSPDMQDEDDLTLNLGEDFFGSDFDPYGGEDAKGERSEDETMQDEPEDIPGVSHEGDLTKARSSKAVTRKAKVSKDDSASSFGEKDDDIPGNRQADVDDKNKDADEYVIQGGAGAGTGPVSKALLKAVGQVVDARLEKAGVIRKAEGIGIGTGSKLDKAESNVDEMFADAKGRSFAELNRARVEMGLL